MIINPQRLFAELCVLLTSQGATLIGAANLQCVPAGVRGDFSRGVSIGVALRPEIVAQIAQGPTSDYSCEYDRANRHLEALGRAAAEFLESQGFHTRPQPATTSDIDPNRLSTALPHKMVARLAGLGWIGKCALLVTEEFGSAVRFTTVLTDAPLPTARPNDQPQCGLCTACVDACPAGAPSGREWSPGMTREDFFDAQRCYQQTRHWADTLPEGHRREICGICIIACPHTKHYLRYASGPAEEPT